MAAPEPRRQAPREAIPSVVARKAQFFETDAPPPPQVEGRPFADHLRTAPAAPMSTGIKAALVAVGVLVVLLLLAALVRGPRARPAPRPGPTSARTRAGDDARQVGSTPTRGPGAPGLA